MNAIRGLIKEITNWENICFGKMLEGMTFTEKIKRNKKMNGDI
jgi:hypothetical protein